ncbi:alpha/beta hydrolase [Megasphaera sp. AM44-1BH]|uniref:alpha/beta hydrolase n=1 Tax=Megasphaera sp. AM44-1BH TaxID=2292358 RepID=UPI000E4B8DA9|nr:alpha/beta hydrolase [Megasphaera sp. AM44-1BH]RHA08746.1 alpha/beta hydrolase [Megasphaera sp. AM44-1BH]
MKLRKRIMKNMVLAALCSFLFIIGAGAGSSYAAQVPTPSKVPTETIDAATLSHKWDKTFPENTKVAHQKITFHNRYGITLVGDLYTPKDMKQGEKLAAIAVAGPYGAVKEQVSGRYAQELAARGFITLAFDPSFTGESAGEPRNTTSPDINTEDFSAAVDYLSTRNNINPEEIGILGICGWGGFALNDAAMDTRVKATVTSTMYDMSRVIANGYFDYEKDEATLKKERMEARKAISAQRTEDYRNGTYKMAGGVPTEVTADTPQFVKDYHDYYQEKRGYSPRSFGSTTGATLSSLLDFMNMPLLSRADEIESAVLMIHGEKAHSRYFSEDAFKKLKGNNKELLIIPGAVHTDLYYKMDVIPFDKIEAFYRQYLK